MFSDMMISRFWRKVNKLSEDECWEWQGAISPAGYGTITPSESSTRAHRLSFEINSGQIPTGLVIDHMCRNRRCVNPNHLRAVTPRVNALENSVGHAARNAVKTHCPRGHEYTPENTYSPPDRPNARACKICKTEQKRMPTKPVCRNGHETGGGIGPCKICNREQMRRYREANADALKEMNKRYKQAAKAKRRALGLVRHHNAEKTHCKYGHEFTPENTLLRNDGKVRVCRPCMARHRANALAKRKNS